MLNGAKATKELLNALDNAKKPQTNADRIRSMSDEELGKLLCKFRQTEDCCKMCPATKLCKGGKPGLIEWLGLPAEGD